jgi:citrate lyase subunit beta/citryl-CoA lyase
MRSLLFVPAHDARKLAKGLVSGADALIVDLEDAVPADQKPLARQMAAEFVSQHRGRLPIFVRINGLDTGLALDDLQAVVGVRPHGVVLPKCGGGHDVTTLSRHLAELEASAGIAVGSLRILPIVTETAAAVFELGSYARTADPRLCGLFWGGEDLAADIGAAANHDAQGRYTAPYQLARALTLLGATAAQVPAIDAVYTDFRDAEGLKAEAAEALRDGFTAKVAIHPDQVGVINAAFTPSEADVERARRIVAAFEAAPQAGAIALDGRMLDRPHLKSALRVIARA